MIVNLRNWLMLLVLACNGLVPDHVESGSGSDLNPLRSESQNYVSIEDFSGIRCLLFSDVQRGINPLRSITSPARGSGIASDESSLDTGSRRATGGDAANAGFSRSTPASLSPPVLSIPYPRFGTSNQARIRWITETTRQHGAKACDVETDESPIDPGTRCRIVPGSMGSGEEDSGEPRLFNGKRSMSESAFPAFISIETPATLTRMRAVFQTLTPPSAPPSDIPAALVANRSATRSRPSASAAAHLFVEPIPPRVANRKETHRPKSLIRASNIHVFGCPTSSTSRLWTDFEAWIPSQADKAYRTELLAPIAGGITKLWRDAEQGFGHPALDSIREGFTQGGDRLIRLGIVPITTWRLGEWDRVIATVQTSGEEQRPSIATVPLVGWLAEVAKTAFRLVLETAAPCHEWINSADIRNRIIDLKQKIKFPAILDAPAHSIHTFGVGW